MKIEIKILNKEFYYHPNSDAFDPPSYATPGSAGMDLVCTEDITIYPGEVKAIHTGLAIWLGSYNKNAQYLHNQHMAALILPKSGLGTKGLILANTVGLIDEDYQGELIVQAWNRLDMNQYKQIGSDGSCVVRANFDNEIKLKAGDKFAQLMFVPVIKAQWDVVEEFSSETERGQGGFGSTGR